ncbi:L,D-transpeptidase catalytic domain [Filimonas lacunae]|uniref:L,D-transpeptidase catalytic domain n=1 Tax=Filimonas lacunae TaxID=477680 RepID=A0A173MP91_9BACT|nr:murein L,D-transpeptidase catalytic domain family protein [Filimonas lacunae]BAV09495.1 hypothetical protein FLA_5544 [Filimonas lacunae]SIS74192.1 L,D-transpeptidase catalytic domain [Filimonas lacunae]
MKRVMIIAAVCFSAFTSIAFSYTSKERFTDDKKKFASLLGDKTASAQGQRMADSIYSGLHLDSLGLSHDAFFEAYKGYQFMLNKNMLKKPELLTICDLSQSSTHKRLYVLNLKTGEVLFNTYVSHGKNSGSEFATTFSNLNSSHKSSLGFMVTGETYSGKAGFSMRLDGIEKGINNNVRMRDVVMHGSWYVNSNRADEGQAMGRSYGCPAVPYAEHKDIINAIKDGSCFYIYHTDSWYHHSSQVLNADFSWPALQPALAENAPAAPVTTVAAKS